MQQNPHPAMRVSWVLLGALPVFALCCFLAYFFDLNTVFISQPITHSLSLGGAAALAAPPSPGGGLDGAAALAAAPSPAGPRHEFSLLIGILTRPDSYDARHFLRLVFAAQPTPLAEIHVRFVLCNLTKEEQRVLVALEILRFDDIIVLNCTENMDKGKTYTYFSSLPRILPRRYDYVMKADDDTFLRLGSLAASLRPLPREDLYYGYVTPCHSRDPFSGYMSGMGYLLSWDLVEWIGRSDISAADVVGPEDLVVGRWLDKGKKAKNRYTPKPAMYDYPGSNGPCSHELVPETVAIHRMKTQKRWMTVLRYFNLTSALKPSRLYHID